MLRQITGQELAAVVGSASFEQVLMSRVSPGPTAAVEKIAELFGTKPTKSGNNIAAIRDLRERIYRLSTHAPSIVNGLLISAPHTHWQGRWPIIIRAVESGYLIGPTRVVENSTYLPASFVFGEGAPIAYEWVDESAGLHNDPSLYRTYELIEKINEEVQHLAWPLGLSLNFRFKSLAEKAAFSTTESPVADDGGSTGLALIRPSHHVIEDANNFGQVGWHAFSDAVFGLNESEIEVFTAIRKLEEVNSNFFISNL